jgi:hypothetical protein
MRTKHVQRSLFSVPGLLTKFLFVFALLIVLANAAVAYTVVFRDGHRVEVPPVFILSTTTLTYEAAPGINRTVQLVLIDVAATERANNEAPGSFFKHAEPNQVGATGAALTRSARHTLTNLDLEPIRQRRIESEQNYEKRRIELGLPSVAETRRRQSVEEDTTLDLVRRRAAAEANDEAYWRSRAGGLRNEILTVDAEINYVRGQLGSVRQVPLIAQSFIIGGAPFGSFRGRPGMSQPGAGRMGAQGPIAGSQSLTNLGVGVLRSRRPSRFGFPRGGFGLFPIIPFGYADNSYNLSVRLDDLLERRAGLEALWRELENEARIAKVPQVWLAP